MVRLARTIDMGPNTVNYDNRLPYDAEAFADVLPPNETMGHTQCGLRDQRQTMDLVQQMWVTHQQKRTKSGNNMQRKGQPSCC